MVNSEGMTTVSHFWQVKDALSHMFHPNVGQNHEVDGYSRYIDIKPEKNHAGFQTLVQEYSLS